MRQKVIESCPISLILTLKDCSVGLSPLLLLQILHQSCLDAIFVRRCLKGGRTCFIINSTSFIALGNAYKIIESQDGRLKNKIQ